MTMVDIQFIGDERLTVPRAFVMGAGGVFQDTGCLLTNLDFDRHGELLSRIARVVSNSDKASRVRLTAKIASSTTQDILRILEFSNYLCHDTVIDIAASTLATRLERLSPSEIALLFGIDYDARATRVPSHHILTYFPSFV